MPLFSDPADVLRRRSFRALLGLNFLVWFAGYQVFPLVPLHLRELGASLAQSGRFSALLTVGTALGALGMGRLGDRFGQARVLRLCASLLTLLLASYPFLSGIAAFLLLAPLHGLLWAGLKTSAMGLAATLLPLEERAAGLSRFGLAGALGVALGPMTGLALEPLLHFGPLLFVLALLFLLPAFAPGLGAASEPGDEGPQGSWPGLKVAAPALLLFAWGLPQGGLAPYSPQEARLLGTGWPAALLTLHAVGMLSARTLLGRVRQAVRPMAPMPGLLLVGLAALLVLALLPGGLLRHLLGGFLFGAGLGVAHTLAFTEVVAQAGNRRGEAVGLLYFAYEVSMGMGAALSGPIMEAAAHRFGPASGFRVGWAAAGLPLLLVLPFARRVRRSRTNAHSIG